MAILYANTRNKGKSLLAFPLDYTVVDLETTGYDPYWDGIIEIGALRVRNGKVVETYQTFVDPERKLDSFIVELTGITDQMLEGAPRIEEVIQPIFDFIGNDIILGHNVGFDINFLYDRGVELLGKELSNDHINTLRISHRVLPQLEHHRLVDIAEFLDVHPEGLHRAIWDCETTHECYLQMREIVENNGGIEAFIDTNKRRRDHHVYDLRSITAECADFDESHPLFGKHCVFTGTLERLSRVEAAQLVVNLGGICDNGVTKKTNYLILGDNYYVNNIKDGKSSKRKKAEEYQLKGMDIQILSENAFYDMLDM